MNDMNEDSTFICPRCDYETEVQHELVRHMKDVHSVSLFKFHCEHCNFATNNDLQFINHSKKHGILWNCKDCDFETRTKADLNKHMKLHINFQCTMCDFKTLKKTHLKGHIEAAHMGIDRLKCNFCDYYAPKNIFGSRKKHLKLKHLKIFESCIDGNPDKSYQKKFVNSCFVKVSANLSPKKENEERSKILIHKIFL